MGFGIGDWDWVLGFGIGDWKFIILIWMLFGCWMNEKLAPTQSDIIFGFLKYR